MNGIRIEKINGRTINYSQLTAESGFCFYDADEETRSYLTSITTPIVDPAELERKYIAVWGDAEELNAQLREERQKAVEDDGSRI